MKVRNWMRRDPPTIGSDALVVEAKRLMSEQKVRALPVVDDGRLRGLITRAIALRIAEFVARSQDRYEFDYYAKRLRVRDVMVRRVVAVDADDTMEHALLLGQELGMSQFPVLEGQRVVGMISAAEVFRLAANVLGAWEWWSGITLQSVTVETETLSTVADIVHRAGARLQSLFSVPTESEGGARRVIIRFDGDAGVEDVVKALEDAGFSVLEACLDVQRCDDLPAAGSG